MEYTYTSPDDWVTMKHACRDEDEEFCLLGLFLHSVDYDVNEKQERRLYL